MLKIIASVLVVVGATALTACSAADEDAPRSAAQAFVNGLSGPPAGVCAMLAPRAVDALGPSGCGPGTAVASLPREPVESVSVWGDEAQARTRADTLFLHDFSTGWRVTGAGCHPRNEQVYDCSVGGR